MSLGTWVGPTSRARGLSTRLLGREALLQLASADSLPALALELARHGRGAAGTMTPALLGRQVRRAHALILGSLARWTFGRPDRLAVVFLEEDRQSLQAIFRHVLAGRPARAALVGLIPTLTLPERALSLLADQATLADVTRLLRLWQHPLTGALPPPQKTDAQTLAALQRLLDAAFLQHAVAAGRRGDRVLRDHTRTLVDLTNAQTLLVALRHPDPKTRAAWVPGGRLLSRQHFDCGLGVDGEAALRSLLREVFAGTSLAAPLTERPPRHGAVELALLEVLLVAMGRTARHEPLSTAPILALSLGLRAEAADLRTLIWGIAQGTATTRLQAALVTP